MQLVMLVAACLWYVVAIERIRIATSSVVCFCLFSRFSGGHRETDHLEVCCWGDCDAYPLEEVDDVDVVERHGPQTRKVCSLKRPLEKCLNSAPKNALKGMFESE